MTVSSAVAKSGPYTGNDDFIFAYNFRVFADAEILVTTVVIATGVEEELTLTTDYTVQDAGDPTGTITLTVGTFPTGLPSTKKLVVSRNMDFLQEIDFENQGGFFPDTHEDGLDRLKMEVQQLQEEMDRSIKVNVTSETTPDDLLDDINTSVAAAAASAATAGTNAETAEENAETAEANAETAEANAETAQAAAEAAQAAQAAAEAIDAYTKAEMNAGQMDTRYYTEAEANAAFAPKRVSNTSATTSGTQIDFTDIPAGVTRIAIVFDRVSLSGINKLLVQLGDSGGIETTGYQGSGARHIHASTPGIGVNATGMEIRVNSAAYEIIGTAVWDLIDSTNNVWVGTFTGDFATNAQGTSASRKALSGTLTQLRLTPTGANTFDNGQVTIFYQ